MIPFQKITLLLLRLSLGTLYFYAGLKQILTDGWSADGYLNSAQTFHGLFAYLTSPTVLPIINFVNKWALILLGFSLLAGLLVRVSTTLGSALMFLYYLVTLHFPFVGKNYFLVDEHIVFIIGLLTLNAFHAGRVWGLDGWIKKSFQTKIPRAIGEFLW